MDIRLQPSFDSWSTLLTSPSGDLFGESLTQWRLKAKISLGIPTDVPVILVGHQPIFFHPGILTKCIAAQHLAKQVDGVFVFLVVDHHIGNSGVIDIPVIEGDARSARQVQLASVDPQIAMKDQGRVQLLEQLEPFTSALESAKGDTAALQFANATMSLMAPRVSVQHVITSSDLLQTDIGKAILNEMVVDPQRCITSYNNAVTSYPDCGIAHLQQGELPLWQGKYNTRVGTTVNDLRPRALLLTLLARLTIGNLFVHGTGGAIYDNIMERWVLAWLGVSPCNATMATATLKLPLDLTSTNALRKQYFEPEGESQKKSTFLQAIHDAPYRSSQRQSHFQAMHRWLSSIGRRPSATALRHSQVVANRRDWAFPLYPTDMLDQLRDAIER